MEFSHWTFEDSRVSCSRELMGTCFPDILPGQGFSCIKLPEMGFWVHLPWRKHKHCRGNDTCNQACYQSPATRSCIKKEENDMLHGLCLFYHATIQKSGRHQNKKSHFWTRLTICACWHVICWCHARHAWFSWGPLSIKSVHTIYSARTD